jgi:PHP family Zn ribbon phosphoesterase
MKIIKDNIQNLNYIFTFLKYSDSHAYDSFKIQVQINNLLVEKIEQLEQEIKTLKNVVSNHEQN